MPEQQGRGVQEWPCGQRQPATRDRLTAFNWTFREERCVGRGRGRARHTWSVVLLLVSCLVGLRAGPLAAQTTPRETTGAPTSGATQPTRTPSAPATPGAGAAGAAPTGSPERGTGTAPTAVGPLEALPSAQERLLAPVPSQFNWLQRGTPSNPLLESLLSLQGPSRLNLSVSLEESISDNFAHAERKGRTDARTSVVLGTVYRLDDTQKFLSLANTVRAFYQARSGDSEIGFANLALNAGYQLSQLSFGLTDNFIREDNTTRDVSVSLLRSQQRRFLRNTLSPQVQYTFSPRTSATAGYTNTIVIDEDGGNGNRVSHAVSAGLQHRFSPSLSGGLQYAFSASTGSTGANLETTVGSTTDGGASRSQSVSANLGYQYDLETSFSLGSSVLFVEREGSNGRDSTTYSANVGIRRVLFENVSLAASVGPSIIKREGQATKVRINWQANLDGPIPLFTTPALTLTLTTNQSVEDTAGELDNVGLVLRQAVEARLVYRPTALFNAALFANYVRTELLEDTGTSRTQRARIDNATSLGVTGSYALTNVISLTGAYLYQRHDARGASTNFDENRVTLTVTGTFAVF